MLPASWVGEITCRAHGLVFPNGPSLQLMVLLDGFGFMSSSLSRGPAASLTDEVQLLSAETHDGHASSRDRGARHGKQPMVRVDGESGHQNGMT
jgi:hypothetical protein